MELISQHVKAIMEGCKERARAAGLRFEDETLEYIVTNRDLLELSPKAMIPTLYDFWIHDVEVLREKGRYELYPHNPYETVINTRPAISFYNDNNPDWLNVMIFYHVLAHIDFFQNNLYFRHTGEYDFTGQALADKRLIARLRAVKGRFLDYVLEFTRSLDNLVGYFDTLSSFHRPAGNGLSNRLNYYFDVFLQTVKEVKIHEYLKEVDRYNAVLREAGERAEDVFLAEVNRKYPEFDSHYRKGRPSEMPVRQDLLQFLLEHSPFLNREENRWMQSVVQVVRNTSLFFQPQIRTKIMNEGWASYWHETLFLQDERIRGHEVDFARINAGVTAMPRVGLNPYALGMRLFYHIEELANQGRYSLEFQRLLDAGERRRFDRTTGQGRALIFEIRENCNDFMFINFFVEQDFIDRHQLFVAGKRLDEQRMVWQYFIQSRKSEDYRKMLLEGLYHPPSIQVDPVKTKDGTLYLQHRFEGRQLIRDFIPATMMGLEYLWGGTVQLETSELEEEAGPKPEPAAAAAGEFRFQRMVYTMEKRRLSRKKL